MRTEDENQSTTVVKIGGNAGVDTEAIVDDIAELVDAGRRVVVVHGGSAEIERLADEMGVPQARQVAPDGVTSRHTDAKTLEVVTLALAGSVKPRLVQALARRSVRALGMTGLDGRLILARRKGAQRALVDGRIMLVRDNLAGTVEHVETEMLNHALDQGLVPVVSPPAITMEGEAVNVDADRAAAAIASAIEADELVLLTGAAGVQSDAADPRSVLSEVVIEPKGPPPRWAKGGMAMKLVAAREALLGGVGYVVIADGRRPGPVRGALDGGGTWVTISSHRRKSS
ncbi:[LysW]-aminoadipate kinase [Streptomyces sp. NPDC092370]|uniref:[LysW]-aminoadipate kinase n=1 Tax=Streptomyces sp. NPDC092370 TaxID=3366016 RepID=UPI0037F5A84A